MLILSRKVGESIVIGDDIFITVLSSKGNQVSMGFDAPDSLTVHRHEIHQKIKSEKEHVVLDSTRKYCPSMQQSINHNH